MPFFLASSSTTDFTPLSAEDHSIKLKQLSPFSEAELELTAKNSCLDSRSFQETLSIMSHMCNRTCNTAPGKPQGVKDTMQGLESVSVMTLATMHDFGYKTLGFLTSSRASAAETRSLELTPTFIVSTMFRHVMSVLCICQVMLHVINSKKEVLFSLITHGSRWTWKFFHFPYPHLYNLAMKVLCPPPPPPSSSSVSCERVFSKARELASKR